MKQLEKKRAALAAKIERRNKLSAEIKILESEIATAEAKEITQALHEMQLTPKQALSLLEKAKGTLVSTLGEADTTREDATNDKTSD